MTIRRRVDAALERLPSPRPAICECPDPPRAVAILFRVVPKVVRPDQLCRDCGRFRYPRLLVLAPLGWKPPEEKPD
ncbi:MAG: hypothetical protein ACOYPS_09545 [Phycisphaerales bacterium]